MNESLVNRVKLSLKSKCYFVNDTWLRECTEYYVSEHDDANLNAVEAFVISQWILSDLREINNERSCLPQNFNNMEKITLPGKYILQVDKMCDISQSKYSQLQKIRNVSEVNIKATAIETPAWEPKGKRMIQMHLTDGMQDFTAIEYRPIKTLKDWLLPGFKLMIIGPVMCRKGVMMLKEENYKEIGGEVDSLLKVNALENVLARALGLEENQNPYADNNEEDKAAVENETEFPEDEFDINFDEITQIERLSMESREPDINRRPNSADLNPRNNATDYRNPSNNKEGAKRHENVIKKTTMNDFYQPQNKITNNQRNSQEVDRIDDFQESINLNIAKDTKIVARAELMPMISKPSSFQSRNNSSYDFNNHEIKDVEQKSTNHYSLVATSNSAATSVDDFFDDIDFGEELDEDMFRVEEKTPVTEARPEIAKKSTSATMKRDATSDGKSTVLSGSKRSADILSPPGCSTKIMCLQNTPQASKKNRKITDFAQKVLPKEEIPPKICDFICEVIKEPVSEFHSFKTVRGKVTRIGNLIKKDKNWILQATITDSTASLEIMFSSQVLEELIGFTVQEFSEKKKLRKTNPEVEEYLRESFRKAEFKVQRMDVLMDLEFAPGDSLPKVFNTRELTEEQKQLINKRIKMMAG